MLRVKRSTYLHYCAGTKLILKKNKKNQEASSRLFNIFLFYILFFFLIYSSCSLSIFNVSADVFFLEDKWK
jgi:hypothetical protein